MQDDIEMQTKAVKAYLKEVWKAALQQSVSLSWDKHGKEMAGFIEKATNQVANQVMDETKIEEIAEAAKQGATYTAIQNMIKQVSEDALREASPVINEASILFSRVMFESLNSAITELVNEQLLKLKKS